MGASQSSGTTNIESTYPSETSSDDSSSTALNGNNGHLLEEKSRVLIYIPNPINYIPNCSYAKYPFSELELLLAYFYSMFHENEKQFCCMLQILNRYAD